MQRWQAKLVISLLIAVITCAIPYPSQAQSGHPPDEATLSPYWDPAVTRWEHIVCPYAQERGLDPDLVASVIWKESLGHSTARGPTGAVGLMGVMPFEWRPSPERLENPWTNIFWGARALAHTIRDGKGDVYYSLAAYNGGWDRIHRQTTRRYAADVLGHYTRAVAMQYELPTDGEWIAVIAAEGGSTVDTITVIGPQRPLTRYSERPWLQANIPSVPIGASPHATVLSFVDQHGAECQVNLWFMAENGTLLAPPAIQSRSSTEPMAMDMGTETILYRPPWGLIP